jgi:hypothetical protein
VPRRGNAPAEGAKGPSLAGPSICSLGESNRGRLLRDLLAQLSDIACGEARALGTEAGGDIIGDRRDLVVGIGMTEGGIDSAPSGVSRVVPHSMICATLVPLGSLTAVAPVSVAIGETGLSPVQPWQLTQPPSNTSFPRALSLPPPSLCEAGAGDAGVADRSGEATAGTLLHRKRFCRSAGQSRASRTDNERSFKKDTAA